MADAGHIMENIVYLKTAAPWLSDSFLFEKTILLL